MKRFALTLLSTALLTVGLSTEARAQVADVGDEAPSVSSSSRGLGLGVEALLLSPDTPSANLAMSYDTGPWRIDGLLGMLFVEDRSTSFSLGGRFMYAIHSARNADFSLGGGLALGLIDPDGIADTYVRIALEGGFQLRVFLASNFALNATGGLGVGFGDGDFVFGLTGQLLGGLGVIYYF